MARTKGMAQCSLAKPSDCVVVFVFLLTMSPANGGNILMNALLGEGSHFLCMASIGESLVRHNHSVTMLISNAYEERATDPRFSSRFSFAIFNHTSPVEEIHRQFDDFNRQAFSSSNAQLMTILQVISIERGEDCDAILGNHDFLTGLKRENFDLFVFDVVWYCGPLIARSLGIPYIVVIPVPSPCTFSGIMLQDGSLKVSYVPEFTTGFTNDMDFIQRVQNTLQNVFLEIFTMIYRKPYNILNAKYNIAPNEDLFSLYSKAELYLFNADFAVEFPCTMSPSFISVGGLTARPSKPLDNELEEIMQNSGEHGVVICTTGTYFTDVPPHIIKAFSAAFARLPQKVIWQLSTPPEDLPPNVFVYPWVPQNDLLGHPKTKVLMYQGGNNGFYEAVYHGVPLITFPIHADQYDVGARVVARGIGRNIDKRTISSDVLYEALIDVLYSETYKDAMRRVSAIFRDRPLTPSDRARFWIEHVMKYGGQYMSSLAPKMNFIQRNAIDVFVFLLALITAFCWLLVRAVFTGLCWCKNCYKLKLE